MSALWVLIALIIGAQNALAAALRGEAAAVGAALRPALVQTVPWIPASIT